MSELAASSASCRSRYSMSRCAAIFACSLPIFSAISARDMAAAMHSWR